MTYRAVIVSIFKSENINDPNGGAQITSDVWIQLYDAVSGAQAQGNWLTVYFTATDQSGNATGGSVQIFTAGALIYSGVTQDSHYDTSGQVIYNNYTNWTINRVDVTTQGNAPSSPCDARISQVSVTNESAAGARDGKALISVLTSHPPVTYSIDNITFQASNSFAGLTAGLYTAYIKDNNVCTFSLAFQVLTLKAILVTDPSKPVDIGNVSRWNAAFNPIIFTYQRQDFQVASVTAANLGTSIVLNLQTGMLSIFPKNAELIYLNAGPYQGMFLIAGNTSNTITLNTPFLGTATGFTNVNSERLYYRVITSIKYIDPDLGSFVTQQLTASPNLSGLTLCDVSGLIRSILKARDNFLYNAVSYLDSNLSVSYQISYSEVWQGNVGSFIPIAAPYYAVWAAFQIQEPGADNMGPYVPFAAETDPTKKAAWLSDFTQPVLFGAMPFDLPFIYSENLAGQTVSAVINYLDINKVSLGPAFTSSLLNEDASFLLNQDASRLLISKNLVGGAGTLAQQVGLNRLNLTASYPANVYYLDIVLTIGTAPVVEITKHITVSLSTACPLSPVYLKWIGKHGGWNYYMFGFNQEVSLNVQNMQLVKRRPTNYLTASSMEDVVSKVANRKVTVYADNVPVNDINGIESIYDSPKVMVLQPSGLWQTVIVNTASYKLFDTQFDQFALRFTFDMATKNVQYQ